MKTWSLDALFEGFETKEFKDTIATIEQLIEEADAFAQSLGEHDTLETIKRYLELSSTLRHHFVRASGFVNLSLATDAQDETSNAWMNTMQQLASRTTDFNTKFSKWLPTVDNLDALIETDALLKEHEYVLRQTVKNAQYVLSDKEEQLISKLSQTGSKSWSQLQGLLTSIVEVDFKGEKLTLSDIKNKAHSRDAEVRKAAYEAEMAAYGKIEHSVAYALNSIKGEVNEVNRMRGFASPLDKAVNDSRMQKKTLDALIASMREHLPMFRDYLKRKASLLGYEGSLPWYDLFAPMGQSERSFSEKEAMDYVIKNFETFGDDLANLARRAYDESWIDFTPRKGKRGGAFCSNLHPIGQSRILTNFTGSFSNVITLAHELGHAYHGEKIFSESILNASYTMPVAETASTLCETIVKKAAINDSKGDEKLFILEQSLMGTTQVIVDILSRFIFERSVFEQREKSPLSVEQIKTLMKDAQKEAYGDGVDHDTLHPYAWLNKPHYYRPNLSFYNFPYAFGLLFAKGIYAIYQQRGQTFTKDIDHLLQKTGQMDVEEVADLIGIDVTQKEFWDRSLGVIKEEIDEFMRLSETK